jgi:hypothetical protein
MEVGGPPNAPVSVTLEKSLGYPLNRRLDGAQSEGFAKKHRSRLPDGIQNPDGPACTLVTVLSVLSQLLKFSHYTVYSHTTHTTINAPPSVQNTPNGGAICQNFHVFPWYKNS